MWFDHPDYAKIMEVFWGNYGVDSRRLSEKLESCKEMLKSSSLCAFGDVQKRIKKLKHQLEEVRCEPRSAEIKEREMRISKELDWWLVREETFKDRECCG
ncbi:hypothetical protein QQ045_030028 [Rhodiola kirilowii]